MWIRAPVRVRPPNLPQSFTKATESLAADALLCVVVGAGWSAGRAEDLSFDALKRVQFSNCPPNSQTDSSGYKTQLPFLPFNRLLIFPSFFALSVFQYANNHGPAIQVLPAPNPHAFIAFLFLFALNVFNYGFDGRITDQALLALNPFAFNVFSISNLSKPGHLVPSKGIVSPNDHLLCPPWTAGIFAPTMTYNGLHCRRL